MTFQNYLQHALNRIDRAYKGAEFNPEDYADVAQNILDETSKRLAKLGQTELYEKSLDVPPFDPVAIKTFLTRCISTGELLTIEQVAELFKMDARSIRRNVTLGKFPEPLKIGRLVRWRRIDLDRLQ